MGDKRRKWTAEEVVELVRRKYAEAQRYAVFEQVSDGTGAGSSQWIDVAVMALWPSDGLRRMAFEVKVDRRDFLNEIENHIKNQWARDCFHEFWYVAPAGIIKSEHEVPEGCGWLAATGRGLQVKLAAKRKNEPSSGDHLFASFCRSARKEVVRAKMAAKKDVIDNDPTIQDWKSHHDACEQFLRSRGAFSYSNTVEQIVSDLENATMDGAAKQDREQILKQLDSFQNNIFSMFEEFCQLAHVGLTERDDLNSFVLQTWGGNGMELAKRRLSTHEKENAKAAKESREIIDRIGGADEFAPPRTKRPATGEAGRIDAG